MVSHALVGKMSWLILYVVLQIKPEWLYELAPHFYEYGTVSFLAACHGTVLRSVFCSSRKENLQKLNGEEQMLARSSFLAHAVMSSACCSDTTARANPVRRWLLRKSALNGSFEQPVRNVAVPS